MRHIGEALGVMLAAVIILAVAAILPVAIIWALNTLGATIAYNAWTILAVIVLMLAVRFVSNVQTED